LSGRVIALLLLLSAASAAAAPSVQSEENDQSEWTYQTPEGSKVLTMQIALIDFVEGRVTLCSEQLFLTPEAAAQCATLQPSATFFFPAVNRASGFNGEPEAAAMWQPDPTYWAEGSYMNAKCGADRVQDNADWRWCDIPFGYRATMHSAWVYYCNSTCSADSADWTTGGIHHVLYDGSNQRWEWSINYVYGAYQGDSCVIYYGTWGASTEARGSINPENPPGTSCDAYPVKGTYGIGVKYQ